uniref:Hexosyltransferase n=1 Tax=Fagus sylvatica TaxID=28930 RepID=A0A2N9FG13_FAGSY
MAPNITTNATAITKPVSMPSKAYVTFLAGNGDYVKGVVGLAKGLRKVKTKYPLVVAILPDVPEEHREILVSQGCIVKEIEPLHPPENQTQFAMAYYVINYSKLRIWEFVEYSKMIYLDGDIQVFENIDHLFDLPDNHFYGVMDCFCEKNWSNTPQHKIGYCQQCPDKVNWPAELGPKPPLYFNAGMFVYEPNLATYHDLLETVQATPPTTFAEQDFLNMYFKDIYKPISPVYNLVLAMLWRHPENIEFEKVKVVHYCADGSKPWRYTGEEVNMDREDIKMLVQKWWDIYNDESLDYQNTLASVEASVGAEKNGLKRFLTALSEAVVDAVDPKSRHKGKLETESLLKSRGVNWTSLRPVYIYGPLNYNPVEEWFFHRLKAGRPIPIPNSGIQITQLGHVKDLARAFVQVLGNEKASKQVFNISGEKYVTFDGLARACAKAGGFPEPEIIHFNPKEFDFGKKKAFPFRDQHFFASIDKAKSVLGWKPEFDQVEGLADSYNLDFGRGTFRKEADFSTDDLILGKSLVLQS